jgi:hypothetical protein
MATTTFKSKIKKPIEYRVAFLNKNKEELYADRIHAFSLATAKKAGDYLLTKARASVEFVKVTKA